MNDSTIGAQLRDARRAQGISLRGLAQSAGISASLLSQVETGKSQPSVSTLYAIANRLGISIDEILALGRPKAAAPEPAAQERVAPVSAVTVQHADENPVLEMENGVRWERLATAPGDEVEGVLVTYSPGASSSLEGRFMRHSGVEHAMLIEGELTLKVDFETFELRPGDSLRFDSVRPHLYINRTDRPARGIWFVVGRHEHHRTMPASGEEEQSPAPATTAGSGYASVVDVLRALDDLPR